MQALVLQKEALLPDSAAQGVPSLLLENCGLSKGNQSSPGIFSVLTGRGAAVDQGLPWLGGIVEEGQWVADEGWGVLACGEAMFPCCQT